MNGAMRNSHCWMRRRRQGRRARMQNNTYTTTSLALREPATPTPKRRRVARDAGLAASLSSGHYPVFLGMHGPSQDLNRKIAVRLIFCYFFGRPVSVP